MKTRKVNNRVFGYIAITLLGGIMIYPLVWLIFASLKPSSEVLNTVSLWPSTFMPSNYVEGWKMVYPYTFTLFFKNTFLMIFGCVAGSIIGSVFIGYGFSRFQFKYRSFWLMILFLTIMLPATVTLISRYLIFSKLGWLNTYLPFVIPACLGAGHGGGFFIYLMHQFMEGIPKDLDEAAKIDGCNVFQIIVRIVAPLSKSAIFSVGIFSFMWNWDDFQNQLIYLSDVSKYTVALALRTTIDVSGANNWGAVLAMALCSMLPVIIMFACAQSYFIEGVASTGIKE